MKNPIAEAVAPLRAASVARAVELVKAHIEAVLAANPVGTEFSAKYPKPDSFRTGRREYLTRENERRHLKSILRVEATGHTWKAPEFVVGANEYGIARLVEETEQDAAASFDAYVAKLSAKVGECDAASVVGALWQGSTLTVTKGATIERWTTKQILNVSCLGKVFNQWPTRLAK